MHINSQCIYSDICGQLIHSGIVTLGDNVSTTNCVNIITVNLNRSIKSLNQYLADYSSFTHWYSYTPTSNSTHTLTSILKVGCRWNASLTVLWYYIARATWSWCDKINFRKQCKQTSQKHYNILYSIEESNRWFRECTTWDTWLNIYTHVV